jgi:low affinity Fe/Cu permease
MARFTSVLTWLGVLMARPAAFVVLMGYVAAWLALNPQSFDWHAVATVATWLMTLFIQRAEHRDTQAIHAKLDELLRVEGRALHYFIVSNDGLHHLACILHAVTRRAAPAEAGRA